MLWVTLVCKASWDTRGCWRRNDTREGTQRAVRTPLLEQRATFSENKNFSNKRIFCKKKMKPALVLPLPPYPCMSLVWSNMRVKSRRHHMGPNTLRTDLILFSSSFLRGFLVRWVKCRNYSVPVSGCFTGLSVLSSYNRMIEEWSGTRDG
jgi:hypothetical protein